MIKLENISKAYRASQKGELNVLRDIDLSVELGEFVTITGSSGCGKSTLLLITGSLLRPDGGTVKIAGLDFTAMGMDEQALRRSENIGFVFQRFHLLPYLTVRENILAATVALSAKPSSPGRRADELMEQLGIAGRAEHLPSKLSVGEMQRTALARALFNSPKVILADEPTGNLDPENAKTVVRAFADFAREGGTVLMVTHGGPAEIPGLSRSLRLRDGELRPVSKLD